MKIFLVLSNSPNPDGEAIEVVSHEVIERARCLGHSIVLQVILRDPRDGQQAVHAEHMLEHYDLPNIEKCSILYVEDALQPNRPRSLFGRLVWLLKSLQIRQLFPAVGLGPLIESRVAASGADVILSIWSWEALAATYRIRHVPKFVYYGNPDHLPPSARYKNRELFDISTASLSNWIKFLIQRVQNRRRKSLNVMMMNACEITANNSILDAAFYSSHGHPRSIYLQNMWPQVQSQKERSHHDNQQVVKIIGSVGNLGATGNTFALAYLGKELVPRLSKRFRERQFEIHLLGRGKPSKYVTSGLNDPRIIRRGWVEDINKEILSAQMFLVLTNVNDDFLVGNTRILLAWALRACVVLHANSRLAMPEIQHGENVLMGRTPDEIADWIVQVADDQVLRTKISEGGFRTFQTYYRSDVVVPKMIALVEDLVRECRQTAKLQPRLADVVTRPHSDTTNRPLQSRADSVGGTKGFL